MMKEVVVLLLFCFASGLTLSVSESNSAPLMPHAADESFSVGYIQMKSAENCSYMVVISTSCSSPKFTTDEISIVFGDAHGNQVYVPRLDNPITKTFEKCASDTFQVDGECTSDICFAYLRRSGEAFNGWKPETVKIFTYNTEPVTFNFNTSIPNDTWYGYNLCEPIPPPPSPTPPRPHPPTPPSPPHPYPPTPPSPPTPSSSYKLLSTLNWPLYVVLGLVLSVFGM